MKKIIYYSILILFILILLYLIGLIIYTAFIQRQKSGVPLPAALPSSIDIAVRFLIIAGVSIAAAFAMWLIHY